MNKTMTLTAMTLGLACYGGAMTTVAAAAPAIELAQAETGAAAGKISTTDELKKKDAQFVTDAASAGQFEIQASKLALERSADPKIKTFAQHMVADHGKNGEKLKELASKKGTEVPTALAESEQKKFDELKAKKTGKEFDNAYCSAMLISHKDALGRYTGAKEDVTDVELRSYIVSSIPTLKEHEKMAETLNKGKS